MESENRYKRGKIYKIVDETTNNFYIGSTTEPTMAHRLAKHRDNYNQWKKGNLKKHTTSFDILKNDKYSIILIEDYPCERRDQLLSRERHWIENTNCVNKLIPIRTDEERREYQKKRREYQKTYDENHKESIRVKNKTYWENNKTEIYAKQKEKYDFIKEEKNRKSREKYNLCKTVK